MVERDTPQNDDSQTSIDSKRIFCGPDFFDNLLSSLELCGDYDCTNLCQPDAFSTTSEEQGPNIDENEEFVNNGETVRILSSILNQDAHLFCVPQQHVILSTLSKLDEQTKSKMIRYTRRCKERPTDNNIYSVTYSPSNMERDEVVKELNRTPAMIKPWAILMKSDTVQFQGCSLYPCTKASTSSENQTTTDFADGEMILLNDSLIFIPSNLSSTKKDMGQKNMRDTSLVKTEVNHFSLKNILSVMDLSVCSTTALQISYRPQTKTKGRNKRKKIKDTILCSPPCESKRCDRIIRVVFVYEERVIYWNILCKTPLHKTLWIHALYRVISGRPRLQKLSSLGEKAAAESHILFRTSIYASSILGDSTMLQIILSHLENENTGSFFDSFMSTSSVINKRDAGGFASIHYAVIHNNMDCLSILLDAGADIGVLDSKLKSPLDHAIQNKNKKAQDLLAPNNQQLANYNSDSNGNEHLDASNIQVDNSFYEAALRRGETLTAMDETSNILKGEASLFKTLAAQRKQKSADQN